MSLSNEEVLPAVVVIIDELSAPAGIGKRCMADTGLIRRVLKVTASGVPVEGISLLGKVSDEDVGQAIVIVIGKIHAHAGVRLTVLIVSCSRQQGRFLERSVAPIVEKEAHHGVISDVDIGPAVTV